MAGLKNSVRGATLIDTLVGMTLLVTAFTLFFLVITSIKKSYNSNLLTYAYIEAVSILQESDSVSIGKHEIMYPSFTMLLSKEQYDLNPNLFISKVTAISQDSVIIFEITYVSKENNYFQNTIMSNEE